MFGSRTAALAAAALIATCIPAAAQDGAGSKQPLPQSLGKEAAAQPGGAAGGTRDGRETQEGRGSRGERKTSAEQKSPDEKEGSNGRETPDKQHDDAGTDTARTRDTSGTDEDGTSGDGSKTSLGKVPNIKRQIHLLQLRLKRAEIRGELVKKKSEIASIRRKQEKASERGEGSKDGDEKAEERIKKLREELKRARRRRKQLQNRVSKLRTRTRQLAKQLQRNQPDIPSPPARANMPAVKRITGARGRFTARMLSANGIERTLTEGDTLNHWRVISIGPDGVRMRAVSGPHAGKTRTAPDPKMRSEIRRRHAQAVREARSKRSGSGSPGNGRTGTDPVGTSSQ